MLRVPAVLLAALLGLAVAAVQVRALTRPLPVRSTLDPVRATPYNEGQTEHVLWAYLDPERDRWQQPARVLETLALEPGQTVVDVGAGSGYFSWRLSAAVGPRGRVVALDPDPVALMFLQRRMEEEPPPFPNLFILRSSVDDVGLEAGMADLEFLCDAHFPFEQGKVQQACVRSMVRALKPKGRLAVIEVREDPRRGPLAPADLARPFEDAGLRLESTYDFLERQHFAVFVKPGD